MNPVPARTRPVQRIVKVRRDYNRWVADETLEDYALRFAPRGFRKWSAGRVAHTAFGAVSFLALEAIGASIALTYGLVNALWAIAASSVVIFLTGLPIAYRAARHGLDMDLVARGAGFGYLGSTITSLVYAGFTFIFFAIEAAIMAQALELWFGLPRPAGYAASAIVVLPLVAHGVTLISRLQLWTQPVWLVLLALPYAAVAAKDPGAFARFAASGAQAGEAFSWQAFGAACTVVAALIAQIGEQVDFLRFMPEQTPRNRLRWWGALLLAGPGWIVLGAAKMVGGAFLAHLAIGDGVPAQRALEPTQMYLVGFEHAVGAGLAAVVLTGVFVLVSQLKINLTNAYAGSLAWSNVFARLTHSHPGRVVWLVFNVLIALLLMLMGVFEAIEQVLGLYAHLAVAWIGAIVADLVVSKPLGWSPPGIEFRRAHLHDINPAGVGAMLLASVVSVAAHTGGLGEAMRAASAGLALAVAMVAEPAIALATRGRYGIAREPTRFGARHRVMRCTVCRNRFESDDMAWCPAYGGAICSLCCTLDARCNDRCKSGSQAHELLAGLLARWLPARVSAAAVRRCGQYLAALAAIAGVPGLILWLLQAQARLALPPGAQAPGTALLLKAFAALLLVAAVVAWWVVLTSQSRRVAQQESERQTQLLLREIDAHRRTDALLQHAKDAAERANQAKTRFLTGMSHEMRAPLNSLLGYAQLLRRDAALSADQRESVDTIHRSGEHLASLVDGLLELSRIEHGRLRLEQEPVDFPAFLSQIVRMFEPLAKARSLAFEQVYDGALPPWVHADPKRLRQVLINLLGNAVKFTARGSVGLHVRYRREIAHIDVVDTGIGIAASDLQRIFEPFERAQARAGSEGIGLGLTITRLLVGLMGGDICVDSTPGAGSRFSVRLYLPAIAAPAPAAVHAARIVGYEGRRLRVLVVDDEPPHRELLRRLLAPLGFEVAQAGTGAACLAAVGQDAPDLVLLDVGLPDADGWTVCRAIRDGARASGAAPVAVLMVSGNAHDDTEPARRLHGCDGFVSKPVDEADLLDCMRAALGLAWVRAAGAGGALAPAAPPAPERLRELLALSAGGQARALRAELAELAGESAETAAWVARMMRLLDEGSPEFNLVLGEALASHERD